MQRSVDRILTTHPGRLPDPSDREQVMQARASGDSARFDELVKADAIAIARRQRDLGVDIMSDGEFWKARDFKYYSTRAGGIEAVPLKPGEWPSLLGTHEERISEEFRPFFEVYDRLGNIPRLGPDGRLVATTSAFASTEKFVMTGPVKALPPDAVMHEVEVIKQAVEAGGWRADDFFYPVLGPGWLDHFVWNDYYKSEEEYCFALAEIVKNEMKAVVNAGFILQIDDPGLCDRWSMVYPRVTVEEYRRQEAMRIEATNWALEGIPEDRVRYHTCWGSWHTPHTNDLPFRDVVDLMLRVKASAYSVEAADVRHELDWQLWQDHKLPDGKVYIPGVIAHKTSTVEPPELVADRIVRYAGLMGRENVIAGVDCGLGGRSYPEIAWAKLRVLAQGAELASKKLWAKP